MSLKERLKSKALAAVKRERATLPVSGEEVQFRSLMSGPAQRGGNAPPEEQQMYYIALSLEDIETGELVYNINDQNDRQEINDWPLDDTVAAVEVISRLSYIGKKATAAGKENSSGVEAEGEEKNSTTY